MYIIFFYNIFNIMITILSEAGNRLWMYQRRETNSTFSEESDQPTQHQTWLPSEAALVQPLGGLHLTPPSWTVPQGINQAGI